MSKETVQKYSTIFNGKRITAFSWNGSAVFLASQIGDILGYGGRRFERLIRGEWADKFLKGDIRALRGDEQFWYLDHHDSFDDVGDRCEEITLLSERALHTACFLSRKPLRRSLRRFVSENVVPMFVKNDSAVMEELPADIRRWALTSEGAAIFEKLLPQFIAAHPESFTDKVKPQSVKQSAGQVRRAV